MLSTKTNTKYDSMDESDGNSGKTKTLYLESRWSKRNLKVHGNWWSSPFLFRVSFKQLNFSRQLSFFHSSHPFDPIRWTSKIRKYQRLSEHNFCLQNPKRMLFQAGSQKDLREGELGIIVIKLKYSKKKPWPQHI